MSGLNPYFNFFLTYCVYSARRNSVTVLFRKDLKLFIDPNDCVIVLHVELYSSYVLYFQFIRYTDLKYVPTIAAAASGKYR